MVVREGTIHDPSEGSEMTYFKEVMPETVLQVMRRGQYSAHRYHNTIKSSEETQSMPSTELVGTAQNDVTVVIILCSMGSGYHGIA